MKIKIFLFSIAALCSDCLLSQQDPILNWIGRYEGSMNIMSKRAKDDASIVLKQQLPVELLIAKTSDSNTLIWRMSYFSDNGRMDKDYRLILPNDTLTKYLIDEQDGIRIDSYFFNNCLTSCFQVEGLTICDQYRKTENGIFMELYGGSIAQQPGVSSLQIEFVQSVELIRMKD
jgi:hypothetical protein